MNILKWFINMNKIFKRIPFKNIRYLQTIFHVYLLGQMSYLFHFLTLLC